MPFIHCVVTVGDHWVYLIFFPVYLLCIQYSTCSKGSFLPSLIGLLTSEFKLKIQMMFSMIPKPNEQMRKFIVDFAENVKM